MGSFKRQEVVMLVLEALLILLLIFCYRETLIGRVSAQSGGITGKSGEDTKEAESIRTAKEKSEDTEEAGGESQQARQGNAKQAERQERKEAAEEKKIALTFDDGPHPVYTEKLLDGLKKRNVRATFFVLGESAEKYPEIIERMYQEGHLIGNHTYSHIQLRSGNRQKFRDELVKTNEVINSITGQEVQYVRPPYGTWDKKLEEELNMFPVLWNVDPNDWCSVDAGAVTEKIVKKAKENSIILLHDCYPSSVDAALASIDILQERGFRFVTVEEILFE